MDRRTAAAHVFVADLELLELADDDAHHLARVLRLRPGEVVSVSDGAGQFRACAWTAAGGLEAAGPVETEAPPSPAITVGFSLLKGDRTEWVVQKLTEVGVDRILPLVSDRTIVRWDGARARKHGDRLDKVAREAAMQSRRVWLPQVGPAVPLSDVLATVDGVAFADFAGEAPSLARPALLVGPAGGWSEAAAAAAPASVTLGPTVLRAETAAVAAGVLLSALRTGLCKEPPSEGPGAVP